MIFINGYHASGKSHLAGIVSREFNCLHIETSAVVRSMWMESGSRVGLQDWAAKMEHLYGKDFFDGVIAHTISERYEASVRNCSEIQDVVVTGNRSLEGIKYLAEAFRDTPLGEKPNWIIGVKADFETLLERFRTRNRRPGDAEITEEDFRELTQQETRRGLEDILHAADYIVHNDGTENEFRDHAVEFFEGRIGLRRQSEIKDFVTEGERLLHY